MLPDARESRLDGEETEDENRKSDDLKEYSGDRTDREPRTGHLRRHFEIRRERTGKPKQEREDDRKKQVK